MLVGFVLASFLGFVMGRIRVAKGKMGARRRPQTVAQQTSQTPDQVVRSSVAAALSFFLWVVALLAVAGIALLVVYYAIP
jgi:hypothetical protein